MLAFDRTLADSEEEKVIKTNENKKGKRVGYKEKKIQRKVV